MSGRIALAAALQFSLLFGAYVVVGPARARIVDPRAGPLAGASIEAAVFLVLAVVAAATIPRLARAETSPRGLAVAGVATLAAFFIADGIVAVGLCGLGLDEHFGRFATLPGLIQAAALGFYGAAPVLWWTGEQRSVEIG